MFRIKIMSSIVFVVVAGCLLIAGAYAYYYHRWKSLWGMAPERPVYTIQPSADDTLRVALIGDSWAGMRQLCDADAELTTQLAALTGRCVAVAAKGKGGEKSRGIYRLMFEGGAYGTRPLLSAGVQYCVIFAGINDAAANLGTRQFCHYYGQMLHLLLANNIKPVVVEIPDVDIWHLYGGKPLWNLLSDFVKSTMTGCRMYQFADYREALRDMLARQQLMDRVVYVKMDTWNAASPEIDATLFLTDRIHLNREGYRRLDASIAEAIAADLKQPVDARAVDEPVDGDS